MKQPLRSPPLADLNILPLEDLFSAIINARALDLLIELALGEDLAIRGDITSSLLVAQDAKTTAAVVSRGNGILCGGVLIERIMHQLDPAVVVNTHSADGASLFPGAVIATLSGPSRPILAAERIILNFVSHLSGIATLTSRFVDAVTGHNARIYDTRKTIPGLRRLAKYAVRCGGGFCHRIGLHDAILIKDNHLAPIPPAKLREKLDAAIKQARTIEPTPAFIEIEVDTLDQLNTLIDCDVDVILLDNMTPVSLAQAVRIRDERHPSVELEASGGVTLQNVPQIAQTGVDRISVGALTLSSTALDFGMDPHTP